MSETQATAQIDLPWHILTDDGVFHSGYYTEASAVNALKGLNEKAEKLGVKTRYVVWDNPKKGE